MKTQMTLTGLGLAAVLAFAPGCGDDATTTSDAAMTTANDGGADAASPATSDGGADVAAPQEAGTSTDTAASTDAGDAGATGDAGTPFATSMEPWTIIDMVMAKDIKGTVKAYDLGGGKTKVTLEVSGLAPNFKYGSHVHKLACSDMNGGGHYQHVLPTSDAGATDPMFANTTNEVWLDVMTDATGKGSSESIVDFKPRSGEAKSVVVHAMMTGAGGVAGARLACINVAF